jgi:hypothetical protein
MLALMTPITAGTCVKIPTNARRTFSFDEVPPTCQSRVVPWHGVPEEWDLVEEDVLRVGIVQISRLPSEGEVACSFALQTQLQI